MRARLMFALLWIFLSGAAQAAEGQWRRAESTHFIVFSRVSEPELRQTILDLETYNAVLVLRTGVVPGALGAKLEVYLVDDISEIRATLPGISEQIGGLYVPAAEMVGAIVLFVHTDKPGAFNGREVLFHEYVHHFMRQNSPMAYPIWYAEGFAEYFAPTLIKDDVVEVGRVPDYRVAELVYGKWLPYRAILFGALNAIPGEYRSQFYGQSWLLTHYMVSDSERRAKLQQYLRNINQGMASVDAFHDAFGEEPEALDKEIRAYAKAVPGALILQRPSVSSGAVSITNLPPAYDELLLLEFRMRADSAQAWGPQTLTKVRELAGRFPDEPFAQRVRARAEIFYGDVEAGEKIADAWLAKTPEDPDWLYLRGVSLLRRGAQSGQNHAALFKKGREALALANKIRPDHVPTLYRYARSFLSDPGEPSERTADILDHAMTISPQIDELLVTASYALMMRGDYASASFRLKQIVFEPHSPRLMQTALQLLQNAEERQAPKGPAPASGP